MKAKWQQGLGVASLLTLTGALSGCGGSNSSLAAPVPPQPYGSNNAASPQFAGNLGGAARAVQPTLLSGALTFGPSSTSIWINKKEPAKSLIFATDNHAKDGAVVAFGLDGKTVTSVQALDGCSGSDVQYGYMMGKDKVDLLVVSETQAHRLRIFKIVGGSKPLVDVTGSTAVFEKANPAISEPTSVGIFRRFDGAMFAIVARTKGPDTGFLGEYKLVPNGDKIDLKFSRNFGTFSGVGPKKDNSVSGLVVDSGKGRVYYADATFGLREYRADPDAKDASHELGLFGQKEYTGVRGALTVAKDFLFAADQAVDGTSLHVYTHDSKGNRVDGPVVKTGADKAQGMAAAVRPMGEKFPNGLVAMTNAKDKSIQIYDWRDFSGALGLTPATPSAPPAATAPTAPPQKPLGATIADGVNKAAGGN